LDQVLKRRKKKHPSCEQKKKGYGKGKIGQLGERNQKNGKTVLGGASSLVGRMTAREGAKPTEAAKEKKKGTRLSKTRGGKVFFLG